MSVYILTNNITNFAKNIQEKLQKTPLIGFTIVKFKNMYNIFDIYIKYL